MDEKELQGIIKAFGALKAFKQLVLDFYNVCLDLWKEDEGFWESLINEKKLHVNSIEKMLEIIENDPKNFDMGEPFRIDIINSFISDIEGTINRLKKGSLSKKETLVTARNFEQSSVGIKYSEIVKTNNTEFLSLAREIVSQTVLHKGKLNKRINDMESGIWEPKPKIKEARETKTPVHMGKSLKDDFSSAEEMIKKYHSQLKEYLDFLKKLEGGIQKHSVWMHIERIEKFMKKDVEEHFKYEEEEVFPGVLQTTENREVKDAVDYLIEEHKRLLAGVEEFESLVYGEVFPLPKAKIEKLNSFLEDFIDSSSKHMLKEEEKILPLLK
ncbi:MAG: hemerythrin domain-containing protein [Endomicrobiales bacterium]|nr:hemerythrin domain-containing protein [Endomicrobiales bacterium]